MKHIIGKKTNLTTIGIMLFILIGCTADVLMPLLGDYVGTCKWQQTRIVTTEDGEEIAETNTFDNIASNVSIHKNAAGRFFIAAISTGTDDLGRPVPLALTSQLKGEDEINKNNTLEEDAQFIYYASQWDFKQLDCPQGGTGNCSATRWPGRIVFGESRDKNKKVSVLKALEGTADRQLDVNSKVRAVRYRCENLTRVSK